MTSIIIGMTVNVKDCRYVSRRDNKKESERPDVYS